MNCTIPSRLILISVLSLTGCTSVSSKDTIYHSTERYPPSTGNVDVVWKEQGVPGHLREYKFVATVKARSTWCGVTAEKFNMEVHDYIISRAREVGGNSVVLYCGELGTTGECDCYGDVYRKN